MTPTGHAKFRNFAAQFDRYPISPVSNPCCNPGLKIGVVLSLGEGDATALQSKQQTG
jgi:hypothetical protein